MNEEKTLLTIFEVKGPYEELLHMPLEDIDESSSSTVLDTIWAALVSRNQGRVLSVMQYVLKNENVHLSNTNLDFAVSHFARMSTSKHFCISSSKSVVFKLQILVPSSFEGPLLMILDGCPEVKGF